MKVSGMLTHRDASHLDVVSWPDGCVMMSLAYQPAALFQVSYCLYCVGCHCDLAAEDTRNTHMQSQWQTSNKKLHFQLRLKSKTLTHVNATNQPLTTKVSHIL